MLQLRKRQVTATVDVAAEEDEGDAARALVTEPVAPDERLRLGEVLLSEHGLSPDDLSAALNLQQEHGRKLGAILVGQGLLDGHALTRALARQLGMPTVDLRKERPTAEAVAVVPEDVARRHGLMPVRLVDGVLDIAVADAPDEGTREVLAGFPVQVVNVVLANAADLEAAQREHYRLLLADDRHMRHIWATASTESRRDSEVGRRDDTPIIQLVNKMVVQAMRDRASDIHIEPTDERVRIRFRIDGALREVLSLPLSAAPELISRIKIMADMNIVERRRPQDGKLQMMVDGNEIDVRVATGATIWGETAVLRLLDRSQSIRPLGQLGMPRDTYERFLAITRKPYGMIICSGPTGSGKTTTLYATLAELTREELNVMTIEDPVEYAMPLVNQMQINAAAEIDFASGLKLILRQDPDIILVGEIRDPETANIAVRAALTGHLVMTSVHATDAASSLLRIVEMGVEQFLVASSVVGVVGQRLVRKICQSCAAPYRPGEYELSVYRQLGGPAKERFVRGKGCGHCSNTGFRGRIGVYEVLEINDQLARLVSGAASPPEIRRLAAKLGMRSMGSEAIRLVADDVTTIEEVVRHVYLADLLSHG